MEAVMYNCNKFRIFTIFIIFCIPIFVGCQSNTIDYPQALDGTLDLSDWDFAKNGPAKLDGEWDFYWQQLWEPLELEDQTLPEKRLITLPQSWNGYVINGQTLKGEGYATFRLKILLPEHEQAKAINLSSINSSHKLWVNGHLLSTQGQVAAERSKSEPKYYPKIIPLALDNDSIELVIQVANFHHRRGGIWQPITIGNAGQIMEMRERQLVFDMFLMGSLLIMGFYHFGLFFLRRENKGFLCFGIFCLLMGLRISLVGQIVLLNFFPDFPQEWILKIEYFTFYLSIPFFCWYIYYLFPQEVYNKVPTLYSLIAGIYSLQVLFTPSRVFSRYLYSFDYISITISNFISNSTNMYHNSIFVIHKFIFPYI